MARRGLQRNILQRVLGIAATKPPRDPRCWSLEGGKLTVTLERAPELSEKGGGVRIEGKELPMRVLVYRDDTGRLRALRNHCGHQGRRIDPVPGEGHLQCCSVSGAFYDYAGTKLEGPGEKPVGALEVEEKDGRLVVHLG